MGCKRLNVYTATVYGRSDWNEVLDNDAHIRQFKGIVAVYNADQARVLLGLTQGDWRHFGNKLGSGQEKVIALASTSPGQVFVASENSWWHGTKMVAAAVSEDHRRSLALGETSDLDLADRLLADEADRKAANKARAVEAAQQRVQRQERREQTTRSLTEALGRINPVLGELGINPQTVTLGSDAQRQGILLPGEVVEELVRLASIGAAVGDLGAGG